MRINVIMWFFPSESIQSIIKRRGLNCPSTVIPTGVDVSVLCGRQRETVSREIHGIPQDKFVVGHVGRLAPEKNLDISCSMPDESF